MRIARRGFLNADQRLRICFVFAVLRRPWACSYIEAGVLMVLDLEVIDYLQLFGSTVEVGRMLGISQSSCSRRYRAFSQSYGLGFDRVGDTYAAAANFDVLSSLRQAAQKLRVRQARPRVCVGWQLGDVDLPKLHQKGVVLPLRSMDGWRVLSLLEQRLIDVAFMGLFEFEGLIGLPISRLRARPFSLSTSMMCIPLLAYEMKLLAHQRHPLQAENNLDAEQFSRFPSPALPIGMAPALMSALQNHGLATQPYGRSDYDEASWEGMAADGVALSYGAPHRMGHLACRFDLKPLPYSLDIRESIGMVGHRDVFSDVSFPGVFNPCITALKSALMGSGSGMQWLS